MGITLGSNFTVNTGLPLDDRTVVADLTERDALDLGRRYEGLEVFVRTELKTYQLQGGIGNVNWVESGGSGGGAVINVDTFTGDGTITTFTLSDDPVSIENTTVFVDGVYQKKTDAYTLVGLDIVFSEAPPQNTLDPNNIEVIYTTPTTPLVIPDGSITNDKLAAGIDGSKLANGTITDDKLGFTIGGSSGVSPSIGSTFATSSGTFSTVTNLSVTLTTGARPVLLMLDSPTPVSLGAISSSYTVGAGTGILRFLRDGNYVNEVLVYAGQGPCQIFTAIDLSAVAGAHTYTVQVRVVSGSMTLSQDTVLKVVEL